MTPMQAPQWLPFRIRQRWNHARVIHAVRDLDRTPPVPAHRPEEARAEIHMLLCERDVEIGVLALKSLLRFRDVAWAVAITNDGSITSARRAWIDRHVPGCRWLSPIEQSADIEAILSGRPRIGALYAGSYQPARKLIHPLALARSARVLVLDPDTAFFKRPDRLLEWALAESPPNLFLHDHQPEDVNVPAETREAFEELRRSLAGDAGQWSMPYYFFNSGLLAFRPRDCNLDLAERYLEWLDRAPERYTTGKPGLWFGQWTPEQTAYQVMFACLTPPAEPFGEQYRIGNRPGYTFNHFLWLQLVMPSSLRMLRALVQECRG